MKLNQLKKQNWVVCELHVGTVLLFIQQILILKFAFRPEKFLDLIQETGLRSLYNQLLLNKYKCIGTHK